jgi:hypothetical protein
MLMVFLLLTTTLAFGADPPADPLDVWHQLNPDADLYGVEDAAFANERWVGRSWGGAGGHFT